MRTNSKSSTGKIWLEPQSRTRRSKPEGRPMRLWAGSHHGEPYNQESIHNSWQRSRVHPQPAHSCMFPQQKDPFQGYFPGSQAQQLVAQSVYHLAQSLMQQMTQSIAQIARTEVEKMNRIKTKSTEKQTKADNLYMKDPNNSKKPQKKQKRIFNRYGSFESPKKDKIQLSSQQETGLIKLSNFASGHDGSLGKQVLSTNRESDRFYHEGLEQSYAKQIHKEVKKFNENKKEGRNIEIDVELGECPRQSESRKFYLKQNVARIMTQVISVGFNLHYKENMDFQKVKAYCCENFLSNFCRLSLIAKINTHDMKFIEQHLQQEVLPFLNLSYPRSEEKVGNIEIISKIDEKDIYNQNKFDIVYNSKVQISTKPKEINAEVMKLMNYIIALPDCNVPDRLSEDIDEPKTLYECFQEDMASLITRVQRRELVDKLYKFMRADRAKIKESILGEKSTFQSVKQLMEFVDKYVMHYARGEILRARSNENEHENRNKQKQEQQYKEKVQAYTRIKVGRKIPSSNHLYSEEEIEEGALIIKDPTVVRVLMKWVEALESQIQDPCRNTYGRDQPFRLNNEEQTYLLSQAQQITKLYKLYERSAKVIKQKQEILKNNARQIFIQSLKSSEMSKFKSYRAFASEKDAKIGHICTLLQKCKQNHISSYLNMLLGELKLIEHEYQSLIVDKKVNLSSRPSLITMKMGDLIRCQVTSKPREIVALYSYICLLCKCDPSRFELVRVKNRSSTSNKDILVNIFYYQKIMVEIQLVVKNESAFISCSDKFSHFIYELMRAFLGPINEICSIWSQFSPKAPFFVQKFTQINIRPSHLLPELMCIPGNQHEFQQQRKGFKLPFWCSYCEVLYYNDSVVRKVCRFCHQFRCGICQIKTTNNNPDHIARFIAENYPQMRPTAMPEIGKIYYALDIGTKYQHIKAMMGAEINGKLQVFSMKMEPGPQHVHDCQQVPTISNIKCEYELLRGKNKININKAIFENSHIMLAKRHADDGCDRRLGDYLMTRIVDDYYLPSRIRMIDRKAQRFMKLSLFTNPPLQSATKSSLINQILEKNTKTLASLEKLNLNENGLETIDIANKMPSVRVLALYSNKLADISLEGFYNLTLLELSSNFIGSFASIKFLHHCRNIRKLLLDNNFIASLDGFPSELTRLQFLSLKNNQVRFINVIPSLSSLKFLNLNNNRVQALTGIENVTCLHELKLQGNVNIRSEGVSYLQQLKELRKLDLSQTNLSKTLCQSLVLGQKIQMVESSIQSPESLVALNTLVHLEELDLKNNSLKFIPELSKLVNLKELNLAQNNLKDVKNLTFFVNLTWLNLKLNNIEDLAGLSSLKNLKWLDLSDNDIQSMWLTELSSLFSLQELDLSGNELTSLEGLGSLKSLYDLSFKNNFIRDLKGLEKISNLQNLDASYNNIEYLRGIENLHVLSNLKLSVNRLKDLTQLQILQSLKTLQLDRTQTETIETIPRLKNLEELYLNHNKLQNLKGIQKFQSLKKLEIADNKIAHLDQLEQLQFMSCLNISLSANLQLDIFVAEKSPLETLKVQISKKYMPNQEQQNILSKLAVLGINLQYEQV